MMKRFAVVFPQLALMFFPICACAQGVPAFSGAEGPGANATGGRGGDVYHVTNLDFDLDGVLPGSFKYGINTAPAAGRTIVFDVGGTIFRNGGGSQWWFRSGKSNITIAGQTAPGGLTIAGTGSKFTGENIILRNLTVRTNQDPINPTGFTYDGISTQATNSIIDHVSVTWFSDEGLSATDAVNNTTVQYSTIGEGLNYAGHSYGAIINTQNNDAPLSYHHNLFAHNNSRNPRLGSETGTGAITNFTNNVIYNWLSRAGYSALNADSGEQEPSRTNFINNFYLRGANNGSTIFLSAGDQTQIYQSGNLFDSNKDGDFSDGTTITSASFTGTKTLLAAPLPGSGIVIDSAETARDRVLSYGGAFWWDRNPIEQRIIDSVKTGAGAIINTVPGAEWASVLAAPMITRDANWDVDLDGMSGSWEVAHGLDPSADDHNGDFDSDGYTNLEEYLNYIAEWPASAPIVFDAATNSRYAQITNWDVNADPSVVSNWQPSRYDTAIIDNGTVEVDAVGQHAGNLLLATNPGDNATLNITAGWLKVEDAPQGLNDGMTVIGNDNAATAALNLTGGKLTTKTLLKGDGGTFSFTGGMLSAETVGFTLVNDGGTIAPGESPGMTHVMGDLVLNSGTLEIEAGGTVMGEYDQLVVDGETTLGGTLKLVPIDLGGGLYEPALGDTFLLMASQNGFGEELFDDFDLPQLTAGLGWMLSTNAMTLSLSVVEAAALAGDYNNDGIVNAADYTVWRDNLGGTSLPFNETASLGTVDQADYDAWKANFGATSDSGGAAGNLAVPEPAAIVLLLFGSAAFIGRPKRIPIAIGR
jgi:pectate lyase